MLHDVLFTARSKNTKTGPLPVTYRPATTCPNDCPFLPANRGGCYGTGRIFGVANKFSGQTTVAEAAERVRINRHPDARYLRDRVVGDVVTPDGEIDLEYVIDVATVAEKNGLTAFGYTHAWDRMTADDVATMTSAGYVMNASTETVADAGRAIALGLPAVIVDDELEEGTLVAGRRVVTCPAQTTPDTTCMSCGLCAKPHRRSVVRFLTHGLAKKNARRAVTAAKNRSAA